MREIPLTKGKVAIVDDEDFEKLNQHKWLCIISRRKSYAHRYEYLKGKKMFTSMHRVIMSATAGLEVDHINGNGLDNRKCNLRLCKHSENTKNTNVYKNNKSGYKGVHWKSREAKWQAEIWVNYKCVKICLTHCLIKAAKSYNEAAIKYHGEFAKLNIIPSTKIKSIRIVELAKE